MISAIVLAAGMSERMGKPKPLLKIGGQTFIKTIYERIWEAGVDEIIIVLGARHKLIQNAVNFTREKVAINENYRLGQLSSLKTGMKLLDEGSTHLLLALVDHPKVEKETYRRLIAECGNYRDSIIIPVFGGRRGHPVIFPSSLYRQLKEAPLATGARYVVQRNTDKIVEIDGADEGVLVDIDTQKDLEKHV